MPYFGAFFTQIQAKITFQQKLVLHFLDFKIMQLYFKKIRRKIINDSYKKC